VEPCVGGEVVELAPSGEVVELGWSGEDVGSDAVGAVVGGGAGAGAGAGAGDAVVLVWELLPAVLEDDVLVEGVGATLAGDG